jgi:hypothetical protein
MSPARGQETKSNGQPAPREFSTGDAHRRPDAPTTSWWLVPPEQFRTMAKQQQPRMSHTVTNYQPKSEQE